MASATPGAFDMLPTAPRLADVRIDPTSFWGRRRSVNRDTTIPSQFALLRSTGRLAALDPAYRGERHRFWDSDNAKWLEAAWSEIASGGDDPALRAGAEEVQSAFAKAQEPDGYLQSHVSYDRNPDDPNSGKRWIDLLEGHEMYSMGHVIEACCAEHENALGKGGLAIANRILDRLWADFGPQGRKGFCGHPEIELALMRLWRATGDRRAHQLAQLIVDRHGTTDLFDSEVRARGREPRDHGNWRLTGDWTYYQDGKPLRSTTDAAGHAVRALYFYCGAADLLNAGDATLSAAMDALWASAVHRRMHVTGGMGAHPEGERFGADYDLPDERAYCETCAAIALARWARRLLDHRLDAEYGDAMELALHNAMLSGVSLSGDAYHYSNPMATHPHDTRDQHHFRRDRIPWFGCACCPPNVARTLSQLAGFAYAVDGRRIAVHLYVPGEAMLGALRLRIETRMPVDGRVRMTVLAGAAVELALRIPAWTAAPTLRVAGTSVTVTPGSYVRLDRDWVVGDVVELELPMPVQRLYAHPKVRQCAGQVALRRGPLVWCLEEADNGRDLADTALSDSALVSVRPKSGPDGCDVLLAQGTRTAPGERSLYATAAPPRVAADLVFVPYAVWGNRGIGEMRVWVRRAGG